MNDTRGAGIGRFGMNLLGHSQAAFATLFSQREPDHGLRWLDGAAGWLVCGVHNVIVGGDRDLILGHVEAADCAELPRLTNAHRIFSRQSPLPPASRAPDHQTDRPLCPAQISP
jgi:flavin reductase (DIM6/NTAB) family NADH-FMN oxidoreductase RutF